MKQWISDYIRQQKTAHDSISPEGVAQLIGTLRDAFKGDRQVFVRTVDESLARGRRCPGRRDRFGHLRAERGKPGAAAKARRNEHQRGAERCPQEAFFPIDHARFPARQVRALRS